MTTVVVTIVVAVAATGVGLVIGWLLMRNRQLLEARTEADRRLEALRGETTRQLDELKTEARAAVERTKQEWAARSQEAIGAKERECQALMAAQERRHQEAVAAQQRQFDETMAKVTAQMQTATDEMLRKRQQEFAESSNTNLGQIVTPLRETIDRMKQAMTDSTLRQAEMSSAMKVNIENMLRQSEAARQAADELTRVFKHGSKVQGDWGETVLNELLEAQGFTEGIHYDVQASIRDERGAVVKTDDGARMRPDVILHLDQRREVIIDSKVSLTAFMDYVNAETDEERERCLKAHVDSVTKHVRELAAKDYSSYIQPPKVKMDYVIMFVPHSGALWTALNAQPDLWRRAMERDVYIADEQTLYAALRIIKLTWTQIAQAQNHQKVYELANEMMDRVGQFMRHYQSVGRALENARRAYDDAEKKLQPQGQSILQTCGKLQRLGAKQSGKNPLPQLLDVDDVPATELSDEATSSTI